MVTATPPFAVIVPPLTAEFVVVSVTAAVEIVAVTDVVVKVNSFPYAVPAPLVA
jgi:hypothetical protein